MILITGILIHYYSTSNKTSPITYPNINTVLQLLTGWKRHPMTQFFRPSKSTDQSTFPKPETDSKCRWLKIFEKLKKSSHSLRATH